jgi:hypothetical protein
LYKSLLHKSEFGQTHCEEWFKRSPTKFILKFLDTPTNFYEFWKFETNFGIIYLKREKKKDSRRAEFWPAARVLGSAACHARPAETAARPRPGVSAQRGKRPARLAATRARRPRMERRSGAFIGGG